MRAMTADRLAALILAAMLPVIVAADAQPAFPYDRDLVLDAPPMRGGKRVPVIEIDPSGRAQIDLWCRRGNAQAAVSGEAITFTLGVMDDGPCTPERAQADEQMIAALAQVTGWRLQGDVVTLTGAATLRFRLATN
jgi:heat shock protein HslJ